MLTLASSKVRFSKHFIIKLFYEYILLFWNQAFTSTFSLQNIVNSEITHHAQLYILIISSLIYKTALAKNISYFLFRFKLHGFWNI